MREMDLTSHILHSPKEIPGFEARSFDSRPQVPNAVCCHIHLEVA